MTHGDTEELCEVLPAGDSSWGGGEGVSGALGSLCARTSESVVSEGDGEGGLFSIVARTGKGSVQAQQSCTTKADKCFCEAQQWSK